MKLPLRALALATAILGTGGLVPGQALAHEVRPALLELTEREGGFFEVTWKVPTRGGRVLALTPVLPLVLRQTAPPSEYNVPGARVQRSIYAGEAARLVGQAISVDGLSSMQTDVLLRIRLRDGTVHSTILRPGEPSWVVPTRATAGEVASSYWRMGVTHILEGVDHLLFLLALLLIVSGLGPLLKTVTAFTLAHSLTLAAATLGLVHVPPAPTEAVIALSILFLAGEVVRKHQGEIGLTERRPWLATLIFGLFHGLGFAGALSEVGVPAHEIPLSLLMFNIGVETGQVLFVVPVVGALALLRSLPLPSVPGAWRIAPYAIGTAAAFWTLERIVASVQRSAA